MKLAQLSGATVLRPDPTVKNKNSAPSGCAVPPASPVVKTRLLILAARAGVMSGEVRLLAAVLGVQLGREVLS